MKNKTYDVCVIGGGASGLMSAVLLAKQGRRVLLVEAEQRVGKKILASGNGRCNLSNTNISPKMYNDPEFISSLDGACDCKIVLNEFANLGLETYVDDFSRVYPISNHSSSVLDVLRMWIEELGVHVQTEQRVEKLIINNDIYYIYTNSDIHTAKKVFCCTGGGNVELLKDMGIACTPLVSGLVGAKTPKSQVVGLSGVRVKAKLSCGDYQEQGEVIFKDDGLSGVCVMNAMSVAAWAQNQNPQISLNLLPNSGDVMSLLKNRQQKLKNLGIMQFFVGLFHKNIAAAILKRAKISCECVGDLTHKNLSDICWVIENFNFDVVGKQVGAQVTHGGVDVKEIDCDFQSRQHPNLFVLGEALNVDGLCGGFNLNFAFFSAIRACNSLKHKAKKA